MCSWVVHRPFVREVLNSRIMVKISKNSKNILPSGIPLPELCHRENVAVNSCTFIGHQIKLIINNLVIKH